MSICTDEHRLDVGDRIASLTELLQRSGSGDRQAFTVLYEQTAARVFGLCRRLLMDHAGAEDLTQEVFLEVWCKAARFDPSRGSAMGWMLQIAHHRAVDRIRTAESTRRRDIVDAEHHQRQHDRHIDHDVMAAADAHQLREVVNQLSELRRQAVLYAFFTDYSYQQASDLLGIPLGTFKSRVRDAVVALRPMLLYRS